MGGLVPIGRKHQINRLKSKADSFVRRARAHSVPSIAWRGATLSYHIALAFSSVALSLPC